MTTIWWVRRDLRLDNNPALISAAQRGESVVPIFLHTGDTQPHLKDGSASQWYLAESLKSLDNSLQEKGGKLFYRDGDPIDALLAVAREIKAQGVVWNRLYEPHERELEHRLAKALNSAQIPSQSFPGHLIHDPDQLRKADDSAYRVFTPFFRTLRRSIELRPPPAPVLPEFCKPAGLSQNPISRNCGAPPRWHQKLHAHWRPGENSAWNQFEHFLDAKLQHYAERRDFPPENCTSRLSAALHFGEISIERIWSAIAHLDSLAVEKFRAELGWREFAHYILWHFPQSASNNYSPRFAAYPWKRAQDDPKLFQSWAQGRTGVALVDAGMRELWETGFMHNRVRMICASFLTKNLGFHWREGARWFWDTLVDADLANNTLGWQWVAGCGVDAAPFFRIFNPDTQATKFDPDGAYRQHWLEPNHAKTRPIVDLKLSRTQALEMYKRHIQSEPH